MSACPADAAARSRWSPGSRLEVVKEAAERSFQVGELVPG